MVFSVSNETWYKGRRSRSFMVTQLCRVMISPWTTCLFKQANRKIRAASKVAISLLKCSIPEITDRRVTEGSSNTSLLPFAQNEGQVTVKLKCQVPEKLGSSANRPTFKWRRSSWRVKFTTVASNRWAWISKKYRRIQRGEGLIAASGLSGSNFITKECRQERIWLSLLSFQKK